MSQPARNTRREFGMKIIAAGAALPVVVRGQPRDEFLELLESLKPEHEHAVRVFARCLADGERGAR